MSEEPFTIKLYRMDSESVEDYVKRCQRVADCALAQGAKSEPTVWNFDDTSKFRKVGENSYEMVTPGYLPHPTEEQASDRDTHFAGFAKLLWEEIGNCLDERHVYLDTVMNWDETEAALQVVIAQGAYDLACQVVGETMGGSESTIENFVAGVPDMTEWPEPR
jgi:hypothetical protein